MSPMVSLLSTRGYLITGMAFSNCESLLVLPSKRLRHQRGQHCSTAKDLANQIAQLQPQEELYDSDVEKKGSVEKRAASPFRGTRKGLQIKRSVFDS